MKNLRATIGAITGAICAAGLTANAGVYAEVKLATTALETVSRAELPAQAAQFVLKTSSKDQSDAAVGAMKAAIALNPAAAAAVLASVVKADPSAAPDVAAAAIAALPKQRFELIQIAAKNAPAFAAKIVARVALDDKQEADAFASAVDAVVPGTSAKVASTIAQIPTGIPQGFEGRSLNGGGPTSGPPYVPGAPTPVQAVTITGPVPYVGG
jgi:hypothetical protein